MQIKNSAGSYGVVAIFFHWLIAMFIIAMLCCGLYMTDLTFSAQKLKLYGWHKESGVLILMLALARLMWRLRSIIPALPITMPSWEKAAARLTHLAFYGFMLALPITGWLMSSSAGLPISFFGLFTLPALIPADKHLLLLLKTTHKWLAFSLIAILCLHVLAALKHHFIDKDDVLKRMIRP